MKFLFLLFKINSICFFFCEDMLLSSLFDLNLSFPAVVYKVFQLEFPMHGVFTLCEQQARGRMQNATTIRNKKL